MTFLSSLLIALFFIQPVLAQEKAPKLPNYEKYKLVHYSGDSAEYKNKQVGVYHEDWMGTNQTVLVIYRPVSKEKYRLLLYADVNTREDEENNLKKMKEGGLWLAIYAFNNDYLCIYEYRRHSLEFYRLWKPKWRFITKVSQEQFGNFLEKNYQFYGW